VALRALLFAGLVFHKALWEVLKRRERARGVAAGRAGPGMRVVKVLKGIVLAGLGVQTLFLDLFPMADEPAMVRMIGTLVYVLGLATAVIGRLELGRNWVDLEDARVLPEQSLVTGGIYRYIRHPIYAGDVLLLMGLELALNSWLVLLALIPLAIVVRQALTEEATLAHVFPGYVAYCKRTKRFIPFVV
jgi:protein-S-isoprenylcysteine O-methyltransferase Ste14